MRKEVKYFSVLSLILLSALLLFITSINPIPSTFNSGSDIRHGDEWCVQVTRADGTALPLECGQNTYTNAGKNATRDLLGSGSATAGFQYIALGNTTAPTSTDTTLASEITSGQNSGLARALGTYTAITTQAGNWSISKTFTSSIDAQVVNTTALFNASASGVELAGFSFTSATLQTNDQITINATIWSS